MEKKIHSKKQRVKKLERSSLIFELLKKANFPSDKIRSLNTEKQKRDAENLHRHPSLP